MPKVSGEGGKTKDTGPMPTNQGDLFALGSPLLSEVRGERSLIAFPFFALLRLATPNGLSPSA